jgi:hypothetical protein
MAEAAYPYATHLDIKFDPLKLIDVSSLAKAVTDQWYNQTLCRVNDSVVRLGVMQGEYHWHKHDNDDEFFFVLSGKFITSNLSSSFLQYGRLKALCNVAIGQMAIVVARRKFIAALVAAQMACARARSRSC